VSGGNFYFAAALKAVEQFGLPTKIFRRRWSAIFFTQKKAPTNFVEAVS